MLGLKVRVLPSEPNLIMNTKLEKLKATLITSDGKGRETKEKALTELIALCEHEAFDKGVEYATFAQMEVQKRLKRFKQERQKAEPAQVW